MEWKAYRLVYQAKSPIHIGWHTLGYIKLTRYYITGRNMWGAMTANIVRALYGYDDYHGVGGLLKKEILVSYFYPAIDFENPLLPTFLNDGLCDDNYSVSNFERLFIQSYGQTAVLPENNTAEDQSLHESDFISHYIDGENAEKHRNVYFVGYVFIHDSAHYNGQALTLEIMKRAISEIFVGGDRKYGWGRLLLESSTPVTDERMFGHGLILDEENLIIKIEREKTIPAHLELNYDKNIKLKGDIEPLVGREWSDNGSKGIGAGQKVSNSQLCWTPGSVISEENERTPTFRISEFGILTNQEMKEQ